MNIDFRVSNQFFNNVKTFDLNEKWGDAGIVSLFKIWAYASIHRPNGVFNGYSDKKIEVLSGLPEKLHGKFVKSLVELGFMDYEKGVYSIHDWLEHNPWASDEKNRQDQSRLNVLKRYRQDIYNILIKHNISSLTKEEYTQLKSSKNLHKDIKKLFNIDLCEKDSPPTSPLDSPPTSPLDSPLDSPPTSSAIAPASSPYPYPDPKPYPNPETKSLSKKEKGGKANFERENSKAFKSKNSERQEQADTQQALLDSQAEEMPSMEFEELRTYWDHNARPEGPLAGWPEFKALKKATGKLGKGIFPGIHALMEDLDKRIEGNFWDKGFIPGLAKYLKERTWQQEIKKRDKPEIKTFAQLEREEEAQRKLRLIEKLKEKYGDDEEDEDGQD